MLDEDLHDVIGKRNISARGDLLHLWEILTV